MSTRKAGPQKLLQLSISLPPENELVDAPVVSPDGSQIAFPAADKNGNVNLWVHDLQSNHSQQIPGTTGANYPFWSADGRFIGVFAKGKLIKVDPSGGLSQTLSGVSDERGGTWNQEGVILFSPNPMDGIYRISSAGGIPTKSAPWIQQRKRLDTGFHIFCRTESTLSSMSKLTKENQECISVRWIRPKSHSWCVPTAQLYFHRAIFCFKGLLRCSGRHSIPRN